ncbi:MAG TPA: ribosome maturation factor RimP [Candidatus Faecaligallichristensenella faecipullorum]|nr:ribosome maturation factor RimP [Candidatus Faecaligallichristensenella faecipullorum]
MAKQTALAGQVMPVALRLAEELGLELIDVELVKENTGRFLRFFIDKAGGVSIDDCETYHRRIQPLMEKVDYDYMEVSSPGADRPLKRPADFERFSGEMVEVHLYRPVEGAKRFVGQLAGLVNGEVVILTEAGEKRFEQKKTALVKPLIEFEESDLEDEIEPPDGDAGL